jgi:hypothetical protein
MPDSGWAAIIVSVLGAAAVSVGSYFVTRERVARIAKDLTEKVDRREFDEAMKRLDALHEDLREIRTLLSDFLTRVSK